MSQGDIVKAYRRPLTPLGMAVSIALHAAVLLTLWALIRTPRETSVEVEIRQIEKTPPPKPVPPPKRVEILPTPAGPATQPPPPDVTPNPTPGVTPQSLDPNPGPDAPAFPVNPAPSQIQPVNVSVRFRERVEPEYPVMMRLANREGTVVLEVEVDETGQLVGVKRLKSAGPEFDASAEAAIRASTFEPAMIGTTPVRAKVQVHVPFRLTGY